MANWKKLAQGAAGAAGGGGGLNVEDVFSTYLYEGNSTDNTTITNNIDLSTEGGMVWIKRRDGSGDHSVFDTERGVEKRLKTNADSAEFDLTSINISGLSAFNTDGFDLGRWTTVNENTDDFVSWTFRKAPKFFDVVTYTGNGTAGRTVSHNLGSVPGCIFVKALSSGQSWAVYHRGVASDAETDYLVLNDTNAAVDNALYWNDTAPTASNFTVGTRNNVNGNGITYVAYLFAHNDGDGEFGPTGDQDIIKCGSFTGAGYNASDEFNVDLGFEPQWIIYKRTDSSTGGGWFIVDNMRGWRPETSSNFEYLQAQSTNAEAEGGALGIRSNGFRVRAGSGREYIYIAIRRGPMAVPESATDVFAIAFATSPAPWFNSSFPVDFAVLGSRSTSDKMYAVSRINAEKYLRTNTTDAEVSFPYTGFDNMDGFHTNDSNNSDYVAWMWKRAPNFFDVVAYEGIGGFNGNQQNHNLGVTPEMIWIKNRDVSKEWIVYHKDLTDYEYYLQLNSNSAQADGSVTMFYAAPTSTTFNVGSNGAVNGFGESFIAYLFASLDGVSKVGSYTGTGSAQTIDCGFSSGARFVLIKNISNGSTSWLVFDSERGITTGNDPVLQLNSTSAEVTSAVVDIEPQNSGFEVNGTYDWVNASGDTYIFYAIA
jgi:hypothetical protein